LQRETIFMTISNNERTRILGRRKHKIEGRI
jgi:hypothetical protein